MWLWNEGFTECSNNSSLINSGRFNQRCFKNWNTWKRLSKYGLHCQLDHGVIFVVIFAVKLLKSCYVHHCRQQALVSLTVQWWLINEPMCTITYDLHQIAQPSSQLHYSFWMKEGIVFICQSMPMLVFHDTTLSVQASKGFNGLFRCN